MSFLADLIGGAQGGITGSYASHPFDVCSMAVVRGEVDRYGHAGGQFEWDNCAPAAVALAAGLHASRIDGSPLTYDHPDPFLPDLVICRIELAEAVLAALAGA